MASRPKWRICGYSARDIQAQLNLQQYLRSNEAPMGEERTKIELALAESSQELTKTVARLTKLRLELSALLQHRNQTESKIKDYKSILHPVRQLPAEILCNIFLCLVNENLEQDERQSSIDMTQMIWVVTQVSSRWRRVALSFPRLWSTLRIGPALFKPDLSLMVMSKALSILSTQLYRSGNQPLSVSICSNHDFSSQHSFVGRLFPTSARWRNLLISIPLESYKALRPWATSFPNLTSLHVRTTALRDDWTQMGHPVISVFQSCPRLKAIYTDPRLLQCIQLPFSQIEEFHSRFGGSSADCVNALQLMLNLRMCDLLLPCYETLKVNIRTPEEVTLPFLEELVIVPVGQGPLHLLGSVQAPSLRMLEIHYLDIADLELLLIFLIQSDCPLTRLVVQSSSLMDEDCVHLLEACPSLTSLTLACPRAYTDMLIERLVNSEPRLVPSLQYLQLKGNMEYERTAMVQLKHARPSLALSRDL